MIAPLFCPHVAFVTVAVAVGPAIFPITIFDKVVVQPLLSVIVTLYVPAANLSALVEIMVTIFLLVQPFASVTVKV